MATIKRILIGELARAGVAGRQTYATATAHFRALDARRSTAAAASEAPTAATAAVAHCALINRALVSVAPQLFFSLRSPCCLIATARPIVSLPSQLKLDDVFLRARLQFEQKMLRALDMSGGDNAHERRSKQTRSSPSSADPAGLSNQMATAEKRKATD